MTRAFLIILLLLQMALPAAAATVNVAAAASLTDALKALVRDYGSSHPEVEVRVNAASSGALARQIVAGAPADLFISANPKWMSYLEEQGVIDVGSRRVLAHNSLVFVGRIPGSAASMGDLPRLSRIALGSPSSVPAGRYAEQALMAAGVHDQLTAAGALIPAKDVRQALLYAERGEVDGAFVYRTDALLAREAQVLFEVPQTLYPRIDYPAALTSGGEANQAAQDFFHWLFSDEAQRTLVAYGFRASGG